MKFRNRHGCTNANKVVFEAPDNPHWVRLTSTAVSGVWQTDHYRYTFNAEYSTQYGTVKSFDENPAFIQFGN